MRHLRALLLRLRAILPSQQREQDLAAELDSHLHLHIQDNLFAGMTQEEARRKAILTLGGVEMIKQAYRDRSTVPALEFFFQDLSFGARQLRRNLGFAVTAILMFSLGMAASVAIFAFVDAALIKPLPYLNPSRLVDVTESNALIPRANLSYPDFLDWKRLNTVFTSLDIYNGSSFMISTGPGTELVPGARVSDGFFHTLGVTPIMGRDFYAGEDLPSAPRTVILTWKTWQRRYAGRKDIIGQPVILTGIPYTVVGVLPQTFQFAPRNAPEFWATFHAAASGCDPRRSCHGLYGVGRLKDGVSVASALADMTSIAQQLERQYPDSNRGQGASVLPLSEVIVGDIRPILLTLLGGAGLLLLIACVNGASLLLVRSESRRREIAVRGALGASRTRLVRQFITEGSLLALIGSILGVSAALGVMHILMGLLSKDMLLSMPYLDGLSFNHRVLFFAAGVAFLAAIIFSVTPIMRMPATDIHEGLIEGSRGSAGVFWRRLGSNLVIAELAIAIVLLVAAGLLGKSFYRLLHVDLGFQPDHLATVQVTVSELAYPKDDQQIALARRIVDRTTKIPGVKSAALTTLLPIGGNGNTNWVRFVGRPYDGKHIEVNSRDVSSSFFTTIQAKLLRGRYFTDDEDESKPPVSIVSEAFAKKYFPNEDPLGKVYGNIDLAPKSLRQIIGVVQDVHEASLDSETWPTEYLPFNQHRDNFYDLIARTSQPEQSILPSLTSAIRQLDPNVAAYGEATMADLIDDSPTAYLHRSSAYLIGGFAFLALILGVIGLYGIIAYSVSQRTREIGVRMALGAQRGAVYSLILKEAGWLIACGIIAGIICAIGAATLMRSLLFGTEAWDAPTLAAVAVTLAGAAMLASYIPARRAASVNPVDALRAE